MIFFASSSENDCDVSVLVENNCCNNNSTKTGSYKIVFSGSVCLHFFSCTIKNPFKITFDATYFRSPIP